MRFGINKYGLLALAMAVLLLAMANLLWGSLNIPACDVCRILTGHAYDGSPVWQKIVLEGRLPQMLTALLAGAALGTSGLLLQTAFHNPLAGPSILGIDAGASLGVAIVLLMLGGSASVGTTTIGGHLLVTAAGVMGALLIMLLLMSLASLLHSQVMLLITGVIISYVTGSIIQLLNYSATEQGIHAFVMWGMGNFTGVGLARLPLFCLLSIGGLSLSLLLIKPLDALLLGERYAENLGISIPRTRQLLLLTTGLLTAVVTAYCGPVSFVGLAVPHMARMILVTSSHRMLLPATMLMGALLTLVCNLLSTLPFDGSIIPVGVITPLIGAPVILYVILRKKDDC